VSGIYGAYSIGDGMDSFALEVALLVFLVCFTAWLSYITFKMNDSIDAIDGSGDEIGEIKQAVEIVGQLLHHLLEKVPDNIGAASNELNLQPLIESFIRSISGEPTLRASDHSRDLSGRFIDGKEAQEIKTTSGQTDVEDSSSP